MSVGDTENRILELAARDGIELSRSVLPAINRRGHYGLPPEAKAAVAPLDAIFRALEGIEAEQRSKGTTALRGDFLHVASRTLVEVDESQHFTSFRRRSLSLYPEDLHVGFDIAHYDELCAEWAERSDRYFASKAAPGFGPSGRQRQRAYNDALRDIAGATLGWTVIRIAAPERDAELAYSRVRAVLLESVAAVPSTNPMNRDSSATPAIDTGNEVVSAGEYTT